MEVNQLQPLFGQRSSLQYGDGESFASVESTSFEPRAISRFLA
jgi:hypothetical protein